LRSKLNHAVEATDVKLAASKTALGLHSVFSFLEIFRTTTETCKNIFTHFLEIFSAVIEFPDAFVKNFIFCA